MNPMDRENPPPPLKRPRTKEDFYEFCTAILEHEQYELQRQEEQRKTASSPMDSAGSLVSESSSGDKDSDEEDGGDSWDVVTCYCKKPFAGRAMIECSNCLTWVHLSCAKIKKTEIPDIFWCALCKNDTSLIESSSSKTAKIKSTNILKHRSEPLPSSDTDEMSNVSKSESPTTSYKSSSSTRTKLLSGKSIQNTISKRGRRGTGKGKVIIQKRTIKPMRNNNDIVKTILKPNADGKGDAIVKSSSRMSSTKTDSRVYDKPDLSDKPINES